MKTLNRFIMVLAIAATASPAMAGSLDGPGAAPSAGSGMPTTAEIYERLNSGAAIAAPGGFREPTAGPTVGTGRTLAEIKAKLPEADNATGAKAGDVLSGKTFWGLRTDGTWGPKSGTVAVGSNVTGGNGSLSITIPDVLYSGSKSATATDTNLVEGNIKSGTTIFGVSGAVIQATGNATAANVLNGSTFSNATAAGLTGTMPNNGAVTITPGASTQTIAAGYHNGSGTVAGDSNLVSGNIKNGTTIFGVKGSLVPQHRIVAKTGQTTSYATGDDGQYQYGINPAIEPTGGVTGAYNTPSSTGTRFIDNGDGTVTDNLTALIWLQNANCIETVGGVTKTSGYLIWGNALTWSNALASGACGLSDGSTAGQWRLPNINELHSLGPTWPPGTPFTAL